MKDNKGLGVLEIILILAIFIVFVLVFRERLIGWTGHLCRTFMEASERYLIWKESIMFEKISLTGDSPMKWLRLGKLGVGGSDVGLSATVISSRLFLIRAA